MNFMDSANINNVGVLRVDRGKTLRELTLEKMRSAIFDGHVQPGERLVERRLCEQLAVSRSVVREVLRHLEAEGLIDSIPGKGPVVATLSPNQAAQIYELRSLLEGQAAFLCAKNASDKSFEYLSHLNHRTQDAFENDDLHQVMSRTSDFYEAMFISSGMGIAWDVVQSLNARINRLRFITISTPGRKADAAAEMAALVNALARRDPKGARQASHDHMKRVAEIASSRLTNVVAQNKNTKNQKG